VLSCFNRGLSDSAMSDILDQFLKPQISPLGFVDLYNNRLTYVPSQLKLFNETLYHIDLEANYITTLRSGDFIFNIKAERLVLNFNNISTMEPDAFQGKL
jgi:hypothetical protein